MPPRWEKGSIGEEESASEPSCRSAESRSEARPEPGLEVPACPGHTLLPSWQGGTTPEGPWTPRRSPELNIGGCSSLPPDET